MTNKKLNELEDLFIEQITKMEDIKSKLMINANKQDEYHQKIKDGAANPAALEEEIKKLKEEEKIWWFDIIDGIGRDIQRTKEAIVEFYTEDTYDDWIDNIDKKCPGMCDRYYEMREFMEDVWNLIMIQMWKNKFGEDSI